MSHVPGAEPLGALEGPGGDLRLGRFVLAGEEDECVDVVDLARRRVVDHTHPDEFLPLGIRCHQMSPYGIGGGGGGTFWVTSLSSVNRKTLASAVQWHWGGPGDQAGAGFCGNVTTPKLTRRMAGE